MNAIKIQMQRTARPHEHLSLVPVIHIIGWFVTALGVLMIVPALVDGVYGNPDWKVFSVSSGISVFFGIALLLTTSGARLHLSIRQGFLLTTGVWVCATVVGGLPLMFSGLGMNFTDAFFEAMSGLTTTGSTVMAGLDTAPPGILLLWRALLQLHRGHRLHRRRPRHAAVPADRRHAVCFAWSLPSAPTRPCRRPDASPRCSCSSTSA